MLALLQHPLTPRHALIASLSVTLAVAAYCLAYTAVAGSPESPLSALGWAVANVLPWLVAFEVGKRTKGVIGTAGVLATSLALSLTAGALLEPASNILFELVRRVPALAAVTALLAARRMIGRRRSTLGSDLPLSPAQIDWVKAAGNYVELHGSDRTVLHRAPISRVEAELACHGFVRIHRSTLVRRDRIARVRPLDIILQDGTSLRTGHRYRAALSD